MMKRRLSPSPGVFAMENARVMRRSGERQVDILPRPEFQGLVDFDFQQPDVVRQRADLRQTRSNAFTGDRARSRSSS